MRWAERREVRDVHILQSKWVEEVPSRIAVPAYKWRMVLSFVHDFIAFLGECCLSST